MRLLLIALSLSFFAATASGKPAPKTIEALREEVRDVTLTEVGEVAGGTGFSAKLYQYHSSGLAMHALVARPHGEPPKGGWPVLIANHGHHPNPEKHGITADGRDHRPGDYYRRIPELFVARGFLVVMPDYRGHSNSEGFEFTEGLLESAYYTEDVVNLVSAISDIPGSNSDQLYMWGHSMGGEVTLRALLVSDRIRAASIWSSVGGDLWEQAYYYSRFADSSAMDSSDLPKPGVARLKEQIAALDDPFAPESVDPQRYLDDLNTPIIIQHSVGDTSTAYTWSTRLAKDLYLRGKKYEFWTFPGDEHLFSHEDMETAADRDVEFFRRFEN